MIRKNRLDATRNASLRSPLLEQLAEHRHERALERGVGEQRAHEVRHLERDRERRHRAGDAEVLGRDDLAREAEQARQARREARRTPCCAPCAARGSGRLGSVGRHGRAASRPPRCTGAASVVYGQHRLTRKADSSGGARAPREPAPHFPGEDLVPPPRGRGRRGRRRRGPTTSSATWFRGSTRP